MSKELIQKNILNILEKALYKPKSLLNSLSKHVTIYEMWLPKFIRKTKNITSSFKTNILRTVNNPKIKEVTKKIEVFKKRFFKHTILPFSTGLLVVLLPVAVLLFKEITKVEASWFDDRWRYRAPITISSNLTTTLTDYETRLDGVAVDTLYAAGKINADCSDIRFTDINGTLLSYWIEDDNGTSDIPNCTSGTKNIWIKIPSLPNGGVTLYMYYGNKGASSYSSGEDVFTYFDDMAEGDKLTETAGGGSITHGDGNVRLSNDASAWDMGIYSTATFARSADKRLVVRAKMKSTAIYHYAMLGFKDTGTGVSYTNMVYATYLVGNTSNLQVYEDGNNRTPVLASIPTVDDTWYDVRHDLRTTGDDYYFKEASSANWTHLYDSVYSTETPLTIGAVHNYHTSSTTIDFWYITTYLSSTPGTPTLGSEEETTSPIAYYAFDEGEGSKTYNELDIANMGATAPVIHLSMEDNDIDSHTCPDGTSVAGACDETGGNNATAYGSMTDSDFVAGNVGSYAIDLDGSNDYLSIADANELDATNDLTIEAWVNGTDKDWDDKANTIVSKWGYASDSDFQNATNWTVYNTNSVSTSARGFQGAVFDGRYMYFVPLYNDTYNGNVTRYDTAADFATAGSWAVYNTANLAANAIGFLGGCFDGRYVYFVPYYGSAYHGNVTRYDTLGNFTSTSSWSYFNLASINAGYIGYRGCVSDGTYVYFVPFLNSAYHGNVARYNTAADFATAGSWTVYNTNNVDADAEGYTGATFDGKYIYFTPYYSSNATAYSGHVTRYDTTADFATAGSWAVYDVTAVDADAKGFFDSVFDGKYVYFIPYHNGTVYNGHIARYDTTADFATAGSWTVYDLNSVDADAEGYAGATFDGRYIYLAPYYSSNAAAYSGHTIRYDTLADFSTAGSWKVYDVTAVNANAKGFMGVASDGRYIYFSPYYNSSTYHGNVARFDTLAEASNSNVPKGSYSLEYSLSNKGGQGGTPGGLTFKTAVGGSAGKIRTVTYDGDLSGGWHHVAGVYSDNNISLFVDGKKVSSELYSTAASIANSGIEVEVGNTYTGNTHFLGKLDDLKVYANSRTPSQIYADYTLDTHGTLIPGSSGDNTTANAMWSSSGVDGNTVEFDGTDDYIRVDSTVSNVKSVSFWVKPATDSEYFIDFDGGTHYISSSSGTVSATGFTSPSIYVNGKQNAKIEAGVWNHIIVTTGTAFNATDVTMGKQSTNYYQGFLDELKFYSGVLTADQRLSEYNRGASFFAGETGNASSDLILYLNMDVGYGNTLYNYSGTAPVATISGASWSNTGKYGRSISFDGDVDYIKVASSGTSGTVMLGDGSDGSLSITASKNMNTVDLGSSSDDNGTYADGIAYRVADIGGKIITATTNTPGIADGDKILLINMQGTSSDYGDVGNYEVLTVSAISEKYITLTTAPTKSYDGSGNSYTNQKVVIQRIPQYTNVSVKSGGTITAGAWDGLTTAPTGTAGFYTGIVAFFANGSVTVDSGGTIQANYLGYRGGTGATLGTSSATGGEVFCGTGSGGTGGNASSRNGSAAPCGGGGGAGIYDSSGTGVLTGTGGTGSYGGAGGAGGGIYDADGEGRYAGGGGGGGYGSIGYGGVGLGTSDGADGTASSGGKGADTSVANYGGGGGGGGSEYGNSNLSLLLPGSGGGGGGGFSYIDGGGANGNGGNGGGIVFISANTLTTSAGNSVSSKGAAGTAAGSYKASGGGGAGGSIVLMGDNLSIGTTAVIATYGAGGDGAAMDGGNGGNGRIAVYYVTSLSGTTTPTYYSEQVSLYDGTVTSAPNLNVGADPFSISLWFKHPVTEVASSELEMLASDVGFDFGSPGWKLYMNDGEHVCFAIDDDASWGPDDSTCTATSYNDNEWHHLVARKNASTLTMHVDGIEKSSSSISSATGTLSNTVDLYIGMDSDFGSSWYGSIDEFRMFTSALTVGEIMEEYNRMSALSMGANIQDLRNVGTGGTSPVMYLNFDEGTLDTSHDTTGNSNNGTNMGTTWTALGRFGNTLEFDGTNDYVEISDASSLDITNTITLEGWVYLVATKAASQYHYLIDKQNLYSLYINEDETVTFYGTNLSTAALTTTQALSLNTWYHLTATYDSSGGSNNTKIYINGILSTQGTRTGSLGTDSNPVRVGCFSNAGGVCSVTYGLNGKADDVRIYNYVRTPKQILQDMYGDHNAVHPVTYWAFDEGEGQLVRSSHADSLKIANSSLNGTLGIGTTSVTNDPDWIITTSSCHKGDCLDFVSSNSDYIGIGTSQPSDINSVSFWINPDSISGTDYVLNLDGSKTVTIVDGTVTANNFSSPTIYVNGRQKSAISATTWSHVVITTATAIGKDGLAITIGKTAAGYYNGLLDEVALFNYVLTEADIKELYNMGAIYYK